ncbi:glycosyltransferase family 4 protein [Streptomyces capparidis]
MKISFLLHNAYGIGGTIRSTFNVAGALAAHHSVRIVTLMRTADAPALPLDPAVRLTPLIDLRAGAKPNDVGDPLLDQPSALVPAAESNGTKTFNALTDQRLAAHLAASDADVVIATRPGLVLCLAEYGQGRGYLRIGQEHRLYTTHAPELRAACDAAIARLDAHTAVSEADAATHRAHLPGLTTRLAALPNAVPATDVEPSDGSAKLVVAAGRLIPVKRYDLLVGAWATVAAKHPDWRLRIYGRGPQQSVLRARIDELGLADHITLMGAHAPIETEWAKGSIAAVTSNEESFGMTIVEAMHCGVPVVATDCPHGPGEIITDGKDGLLVPVGDPDGIAAGLLSLIEDPQLRRSMGAAARVSAQRYAPRRVAAAYERLIGELRPELLRQEPSAPPEQGGQGGRSDRGASGGHGPRGLRAASRGALEALLRGPLGRRGPAKAPAPARPARKPSARPAASCRVDADGRLLVLVDPAGPHGEEPALILTRRHHDDAVRLPLHPPGEADGRTPWRAVLDRDTLTLAEGRWDLHVTGPRDTRRRLVCRYAEGRGLLGRTPAHQAPFSWWIPYPTVHGHLSLRTWHRPAHAEAERIHTDTVALSVAGTVYGAALDPAVPATVRATPRLAADRPFEAAVSALGDNRFRFTVPLELVRAARGEGGSDEAPVWDLALDLGGRAPVRVGRILGDVVDRNKTDLHPAVAGVRPYLTKAANLAVTLPVGSA